MTNATTAIFSEFPRAVGNPRQHMVNSRDEFDHFVEFNKGKNNVYSSISHYGMDGTPLTDKISLDFDSPLKESAFGGTQSEVEKIRRMREEPELAEEVLGEVLSDVRKVCRWTQKQEIPTVLVSTGFGFHTHLLFKPEVEPKQELTSTAVMLKEELDIETLDRVPIGDVHRIMRVPNCPRMYDEKRCNHYTIPLTPKEVCEKSVHELLELSKYPRQIDVSGSRKEMKVYEGHTSSNGPEMEQQPIEGVTEEIDEWFEDYIRSLLPMPCMIERLLQPDPSHTVRVNSAVMLFNTGLGPSEVQNLFSRIGWVDYDEEKTEKQLRQLYSQKYASMSCETVQSRGLCVFSQGSRDEECPVYQWTGGIQEY